MSIRGALMIITAFRFPLLLLISNCHTLLVTFTPHELPRNYDSEIITAILLNFKTDDYQTVSTAASLLQYDEYNFRYHYNHEEYSDRLLRLVKFVELHDTLFSLLKLLKNPKLAAEIFLKKRPYGGDLLQLPTQRPEKDMAIFFDSWGLQKAMLKYMIKQLESAKTLGWFRDYLQSARFGNVVWLFKRILKSKAIMLPQMLSVFLGSYPDDPNFLDYFLSPQRAPTTDLIMHILIVLVSGRVGGPPLSSVNGLIVSQAINQLSSCKTAKSQKVLLLARNLLQLTEIAFDSEFSELLNSLEKIAQENAHLERTVWIIYSSTVIASFNIRGLSNDARLEKAASAIQHAQHLPPLITAELVRRANGAINHLKCTSIRQLLINAFANLTEADVPRNMRPLAERVKMWIRQGPLLAVFDSIEINATKDLTTIIDRAIKHAVLPLNVRLGTPILDYRGQIIVNIGDFVIHKTFRILDSERLYHPQKKCFQCTKQAADLMKIVISSFCYLIIEKRTLALGFMFPTSIENWSHFTSNIRDNCCNGAARSMISPVLKMIDDFWLSTFLFPLEVRSLIDSSFQPVEKRRQ